MKTNRNKFKAAALALVALVSTILPQKAMAGSYLVNSTGIDDESLFIVLSLIAVFQVIAILVIAGVIKSIVSNREIWDMKASGKAAGVITLLFMLSGSQAFAQNADFDALITLDDTAFIALITLNLFLLGAFLYLVSKVNALFRMLRKDEDAVPETFIDKINVMLTDAVPVEKEGDVMMDHEYDGIHELDNNLPPWWLYGFYFTIIFGVVYLFNYHITGNGDLQIAEYQAEMQAAEEAKAAFVATQENVVDESNVELLTDAGDLAEGGKTFKLYCAPCHAESGGSMPGGVGPNLTDDYWIHGGSVTDVFKTIKYGVPEKGMVSWQAQLNPTQIQQLASFIKSLRGTNPPNAKEPQGELWQEEETANDEEPTTEETPEADSAAAEPAEPSEEDLTSVE